MSGVGVYRFLTTEPRLCLPWFNGPTVNIYPQLSICGKERFS